MMLEILKKWVPDTFDAFSDYRLGAAELSAKSIIVLRQMLAGEKVAQSDSGLSKREWRELMELFDTNT